MYRRTEWNATVVYSEAAFRQLVYDSDVISNNLMTSFRNSQNY